MQKDERVVLWRRSLVAYVTWSGYGSAGKKLGIHHSTVQTHIGKLEARFGHMLVRNNKNERTPVLNEYGKDWMERWGTFDGQNMTGLDKE